MSFSLWKLSKYRAHRAALEARGITIKQAERLGYRPLTRDEAYREAGIATDLIDLGVKRADGTLHLHRRYCVIDDAARETTGRKYHQRGGTGVIIHFAKPHKRDPAFKRRRVITEGEFKADAIAELVGAEAISVPGVDCFHGKDGKLHPDLAALDWDGWVAELCYDTDQNEKPHVRRALLEAADLLTAAGAKVQVRCLFDVPNAAKTGADDFLRYYDADVYRDLVPLHDMDSPLVRQWRESAGKASEQLPEGLRNITPVDPEWYFKEPPPVEYVLYPYLQAQETAIMVSPGGTSKSFVSLFAAIAVATGTRFFIDRTGPNGKPVLPTKRRVMYAMLERSGNSLRRRWYKITHHLARAMPDGPRAAFERDLHANFVLKPLAGQTFSLIVLKDGQWVPNLALLEPLIAELRLKQIEFVVLDPLSRLHGGSENDASVAGAITRALEKIATEARCTVLLVHHTGKDVRGDMYSGRGSSALNDNTSECIVLSKLGPEELAQYDTSMFAHEEDALIRLHHARCSDGPPAADMLLHRSYDTGLLRHYSGQRRTTAEVAERLVGSSEKLRAWAKAPFTRTQFAKDRRRIFDGRTSERDAEAVFDAAVEARLFVPAQKDGKPVMSRGGTPQFVLESKDGSAAQERRRTAALAGKGAKEARA